MAHTLRKVDKDFTFDEQRVEINQLAVDVWELEHEFDSITLNDIDKVNVGPESSWVIGNIIKWNGTEWVRDIDVSGITLSVVYNPLTYDPVTEKRGDISYDGATGVFTWTPPDLDDFLTELGSIDGHSDVVTTGNNSPSNGDVLKWDSTLNGGSWKPDTDSVNISNINDIGDVLITNVQPDQVLVYRSSDQKWINQDQEDTTYTAFIGVDVGLVPASTLAETSKYLKSDGSWGNPPNTEYDEFAGEAAGLVPASTANVSNKFLKSDGTWDTVDTADGNTTYTQSAVTDSVGVKLRLTDSTTPTPVTDDILITAGTNITITDVTAAGFKINSSGGGSSVQSDWTETVTTEPDYIKNKPSLSTVAITQQDLLNNLSDVNAGSPDGGDSLTWDDQSNKWINKALKLDDLDNVNIDTTSLANDAVLKYHQSSQEWRLGTDNNSGTGGGGANVTISTTAPTTPTVGDLWWHSEEGQLKIYYDDSDGNPDTQWVDTGGGGGNANTGGTSFTALSDTPGDYTGQELKFIRVNQAGDELEFTSGSATNLDIERTGSEFKVTCNTGTDASLPLADTDNWGLMSDEMFDKLEGINFSTSLTVGAGAGSSTAAGVTLSDGLVSIRTGTGSVAAIDLYCESSNSHKITIKAPAHANFTEGNQNFVLPGVSGDNGDVLVTDGNGNTSWSTLTDNDTNVFKDLTGTPSAYDSGKYLRSTATGTEWATISSSSSNVITDDTAPTTPSDGELWWDSNSGNLKVYYTDTDSSAWVDAINVTSASDDTTNTLTSHFGQQSFPRFNWDKLTLYSSTLPGNQRYGVYRSANKTNRTGADLSTIFDGDNSTFVKITDHETNLNANNGSSQSTFMLVFDTPISDIIEIRLGMDGWATPGFNGVGLGGAIWNGTTNEGKQSGTNGGLGRIDAPYEGKIDSAQEVIIHEGSATTLRHLMFTPFDDPNTPNPPNYGNWSAGTASDFITNLYYIKLKKSNGELIELTYDRNEDPSALDEYVLDQWYINDGNGATGNTVPAPLSIATPKAGRFVERVGFPFELVGGKGMAVDSSGIWTFPSPGVWKLDLRVPFNAAGNQTTHEYGLYLKYTDNDGTNWNYIARAEGQLVANNVDQVLSILYTLNIKDATKQKIQICTVAITALFTHPVSGSTAIGDGAGGQGGTQPVLTFEKVQRVNTTY